uniref:Uncharacterized protein n=1 Tax=Heterorhabditis bacteriophora TaxID=37862 RepID=A0A1I7WWV7_HETBA
MTVDRHRYPGSAHLKPQLSLCWCIQLDQQSIESRTKMVRVASGSVPLTLTPLGHNDPKPLLVYTA